MAERVQEDDSFSVTVEDQDGNQRLDRFLARKYPEVSRTVLAGLVRDGMILVDGNEKKSGYRLHSGECISGRIQIQPNDDTLLPEKIELDILFEDENLLVLNKPAGLVVHPGAGNRDGTLANGLLYHCGCIGEVGDEKRPGIVHRLDKDTSGVMVAAKTAGCHQQLSDMFKRREIEKNYLALLHGLITPGEGRLVAPIARHPINRKKMQVCAQGKGRYAVSNWRVIRYYSTRATLVDVKIETGRTHQIRCHMAHLGHPVLCDTLYGRKNGYPYCERQMLHAHSLKFIHPVTGASCSFTAEPPDDFVHCQAHLENDETT